MYEVCQKFAVVIISMKTIEKASHFEASHHSIMLLFELPAAAVMVAAGSSNDANNKKIELLAVVKCSIVRSTDFTVSGPLNMQLAHRV